MDTKIIRHLMRGDFALLKPIAVIAWVLLVLSALAALLATPENLASYPSTGSSWSSSGSGQEFNTRSLHGNSLVRAISFLASVLFVLASLIFATTLGSSGIRWNTTRPVRTSERAVSKIALLLVILTLPQVLVIALVLAWQGFTFPQIWRGVLSSSAVFLPLQLACLSFGAIHRSIGRSFVAVLAIVAAACVIGFFEPKAVAQITTPFIDFWATRPGPQRWIFLTLCALGFAVVLYFRSRFHTRWLPTIASATVVVLSWWCTRNLSTISITDGKSFAGTKSEEMAIGSLIEVELQNFHRSESLLRGTPVMLISGQIPAKNLPPGSHGYWRRSGHSEIWQNGRMMARARALSRSGRPRVATPIPDDEAPVIEAIRAHLPTGLRVGAAHPSGMKFTTYSSPTTFGEFDLSTSGARLDYNAPVTLKTQLSGIAFHYEVAADVVVSNSAEFEHLGVRGQVKIVGTDRSTPVIDLLLRMPSLGKSAHVEHTHPKVATKFWRYFVYLPAANQVLRAENILGSNSQLFPGVGVQRRTFIFDTHRLSTEARKNLDTTAARLLVVVPTVDSVVQKDAEFAAVSLRPRYSGASDYYLTLTGIDQESLTYAQLIDRHPDPETATSKQLGSWLRTSYGRRWRLDFLSEYASRNLDFLLRASDSTMGVRSAYSIAKGADEVDRDKIIAQLQDRPDLIKVVIARDWIEPAREQILRLWDSGSVSQDTLKAVIALEEPRTYALLLKMLADGNIRPHLYEALRQLPGLDQTELDRAVQALFSNSKRDIWELGQYQGVFEIPVRHGLREALTESFRIMNETGGSPFDRSRCILFPKEIQADKKEIHRWVGTLDPEDLVWNSVIRRWQLTPNKMTQ